MIKLAIPRGFMFPRGMAIACHYIIGAKGSYLWR